MDDSQWTELEDRVLRYDGVSIIDPDLLPEMLIKGATPQKLRVTHHNQDSNKFNESCIPDEHVSDNILDINLPEFKTLIPEKYKNLDVFEYVIPKYKHVCASYTADQLKKSETRLAQELVEFENRGLIDLLRIIIFVVDEFKNKNQLWGVGRGSSCASYLLFLIGLHMVDPVKYDIPLNEFLK